MAGTDKGTGYNQCIRLEITEGDRMQKIAVQTLREEEDTPLDSDYYPVMERGQRTSPSMCPDEYMKGKKRHGPFFIQIGYYEKQTPPNNFYSISIY